MTKLTKGQPLPARYFSRLAFERSAEVFSAMAEEPQREAEEA